MKIKREYLNKESMQESARKSSEVGSDDFEV